MSPIGRDRNAEDRIAYLERELVTARAAANSWKEELMRLRQQPEGDAITKAHMARVKVLETALIEITKGAGPFNRDPLKHAENCIEAMKATAQEALYDSSGITPQNGRS